MLTRRCAIRVGVLAGLLFVTGLRGQQFGAPTTARAQTDPPTSRERPAARPAEAAGAGTAAARALFRQQCVKCHGADGTGRAVRGPLPELLDFTDASWQGRRGDAPLLASILDGKGAGMPSGRGKVSEEQARDLVAYVRAFDPPLKKSGQGERDKPATSDFEERYRRLEQELGELRRQFRELSKVPPGSTPSKLQNAASAPKTATTAAPLARSATTAETTTATAAGTMPPALDSTLVNQLFAAAGKADQSLWLGGHGSRTHKAALDGDLDVLPEGMWL